MARMIIHLVIILAIAIVTIDVLASTPASGTLMATQSCEAYISKNKRTNPDHAKLSVGQGYTIFEVNRADNPSWYRLNVPNAKPQERWVAVNCGKASLQIGHDGRMRSDSKACSSPGLEDSYVLALSWQPAFCELHRDKPECQVVDKESYHARNFALHGLWPNKRECGIKYEFCGEVHAKLDDFCDYPALTLASDVRDYLELVMPSVAAGSCLQRHVWFKHGTCQIQWAIDEYFDLATNLTKQFNESGLGYFMSRRIGKWVPEDELIKRIDGIHGFDKHKGIELKCKDGVLVDIYIYLKDDIDEKKDLGDLISSAGGEFKSNCGGKFKVDPIGFTH